MLTAEAKDLFGAVNVRSTRVATPEKVVFLCGGVIPNRKGRTTYKSIREGLHRQFESIPPSDYSILLAEEVAKKFDARVYDDLITLETELAALVSNVTIICESPGSVAELGAFSQIPAVNRRLLVFISEEHYESTSFIKDGPIRFLEEIDDSSVQVVSLSPNTRRTYAKADVDSETPNIRNAIEKQLSRRIRPRVFDRHNKGDLALLIAGVVHMLRCAKRGEIEEALQIIGVSCPESELKRNLFLLDSVGWISTKKRYKSVYYLYDAKGFSCFFDAGQRYNDADLVRARLQILEGYRSSKDERWPLFGAVA